MVIGRISVLGGGVGLIGKLLPPSVDLNINVGCLNIYVKVFAPGDGSAKSVPALA